MTAINKNKLRFHCRRGMGELEDILYPFFDEKFDLLSHEQQQNFSKLIECEDIELWDWLVTKVKTSPEQHRAIVELINQHATA
tara:strand:- start:5029 stop:5277 length:249 start_codon:yes stop_codon:yes gene_type:complete